MTTSVTTTTTTSSRQEQPQVEDESTTRAQQPPVAQQQHQQQEQEESRTGSASSNMMEDNNNESLGNPVEAAGGPLKVLFLSADTGGGHRASAESLAKQFMLHFPGSTYRIVNVFCDYEEQEQPQQERDDEAKESDDNKSRASDDTSHDSDQDSRKSNNKDKKQNKGVWPYNAIERQYKHLSARPSQWRMLYHLTNSKWVEPLTEMHTEAVYHARIVRTLAQLHPDVVVSVHPMMNHVPGLALKTLQNQQHRTNNHHHHIPFFTVVTDLGSAHATWFSKHAEKIYVATDRLVELAKERSGLQSPLQIKTIGLPIRHDFALQAQRLQHNRYSTQGREWQAKVRAQLELPTTNQPVILMMGGGEGVGSLESQVMALFERFVLQNKPATVCVVCGRNETLQSKLATEDWNHRARVVLSQRKQLQDEADKKKVAEEIHQEKLARRKASGGGLQRRIARVLPAYPWKSSSQKKIQQQQQDEESTSDAENQPQQEQEETSESTTDTETHAEDTQNTKQEEEPVSCPVKIVPLGFVTRMAEYMVASDVLVTKAGPGTIAEAAAVGLPVMLTNFLPGQEAGNVDYVMERQFGDYCTEPVDMAATVYQWLSTPETLQTLSSKAHEAGAPNAAEEIVLDMGRTAHTWKVLNQQQQTTTSSMHSVSSSSWCSLRNINDEEEDISESSFALSTTSDVQVQQQQATTLVNDPDEKKEEL